MPKNFDELMDAISKDENGFLVFDDVDGLLDLLRLLADDDKDEPDLEVEITVESKEEPKEEPKKGKHETKTKTKVEEEDEEVEELRKQAKEARKEVVDSLGEDMAGYVVDYAAHSAMLLALLRDDIPLDQSMVDEYNALCEKVHPERCSKVVKTIAYRALREMTEEGKKSLEG